MSNRELVSLRDIWRCFLGALAITIVVCGGSYIGAGGPVPFRAIESTNSAQVSVAHPVRAAVAESPVILQNPTVVKQAVVTAQHYHVRPGDSLTTIAAHLYGSSRYWTTIYWANSRQIRYANVIYVGQSLVIPAIPRLLAAPRSMSPAPIVRSQPATVHYHTVAATSAPRPATVAYTPVGGSSFQACVIRAESGGNPNAQNPISTASGLYGFLNTTWTAITGLPGPARDYSVAEQNAAFWKLYAEAGTSPWAPYDGC